MDQPQKNLKFKSEDFTNIQYIGFNVKKIRESIILEQDE